MLFRWNGTADKFKRTGPISTMVDGVVLTTYRVYLKIYSLGSKKEYNSKFETSQIFLNLTKFMQNNIIVIFYIGLLRKYIL